MRPFDEQPRVCPFVSVRQRRRLREGGGGDTSVKGVARRGRHFGRHRGPRRTKRAPQGTRFKFESVEPTLGFEPRTCCLRNSCSTGGLLSTAFCVGGLRLGGLTGGFEVPASPPGGCGSGCRAATSRSLRHDPGRSYILWSAETTGEASGGKPRTGKRVFTPLAPLYRVEIAFARLGRWRRLSRCYEGTEASARAWLEVAAMSYLFARLRAEPP